MQSWTKLEYYDLQEMKNDSVNRVAVGVTDSAIDGATVELVLGCNDTDGAEDTDGAKLARSVGMIDGCADIDGDIDTVGVLLGFIDEVG
eukprot:15358081-Ditylum_brightwellii.AAC.1